MGEKEGRVARAAAAPLIGRTDAAAPSDHRHSQKVSRVNALPVERFKIKAWARAHVYGQTTSERLKKIVFKLSLLNLFKVTQDIH